MTPREERRFLKRLKARDEEAFTLFVELHQHRVFNLIYRMLGSREEAEDLSQEVFVTVFKTIHTFREESALSTWLYRIAVNHSKNRLKYLSRRQAGRQQSLEDTGDLDLIAAGQRSMAQPELLAAGREMEQLVQEALVALDEDHRLVILLRDVENLSYEEIGEVTGVAPGTVKSRLHRARAALKEALKKVEQRGKKP
ncbi:MAG: sigma-70 family RNA polymerase sigma factor [Bradymonadales bacterium]|nr:sigma-70 family RNA polymerase sigma factor [Bradymonadales bacterium]